MARRDSINYLDEFLAKASEMDSSEITCSFDEMSDTLFMNLGDVVRPGTSLYIALGWMVRVHPETDEVLGLQIEHAHSQSEPFASAIERLIRRTQAKAFLEENPFDEAFQGIADLLPELTAVGS